ncbi:flagellar hook-basal body complex protein FliE [Myxococcota bacterium]|nr:flagellar hook-basal body complex protein FliE [Myxococcota bacterium]
MDQVLIDRLREVGNAGRAAGLPNDAPRASGGASFSEIIGGLVAETNQKQVQAEAAAAGLARGEVDMMDAVVSLNEADLSLRMIMQIRDRALEAYQTILQSI